MVARCKHLRVRVERAYEAWQVVEFDNWERRSDDPAARPRITGPITVECRDCGFQRYYARAAYAPLWLQPLLAQMDAPARDPPAARGDPQ